MRCLSCSLFHDIHLTAAIFTFMTDGVFLCRKWCGLQWWSSQTWEKYKVSQKILENWTFSPLTSLAFYSQRGLSLAGPGASLGFPHLPCDPVSSAHGSCEMSVPKIYFPEEQTKAPPSSATGVCCPNTISKRFGIWAPESGLWAVKTQWRDKNARDH